MLSGWMAFEFESDLEFVQKVTKMDWTFDLGEENPFDEISQNGKNFISELLLKHPDQRMSASDALAHPWITVIISFKKFSFKKFRAKMKSRKKTSQKRKFWKRSIELSRKCQI